MSPCMQYGGPANAGDWIRRREDRVDLAERAEEKGAKTWEENGSKGESIAS